LIPTKDWLYVGAIVAFLIGGVYAHHHILAEGIAEQRAADAKATARITQATEQKTAELQARAAMAEKAYDKEQADNAAYRSSHPPEPVRLCLTGHPSSSVVPEAGAKVSGNADPGASASDLQPMPSGDPSGGAGRAGPDIASLLSALGARADQVSAELREYQADE
jgi:hypothetical protein